MFVEIEIPNFQYGMNSNFLIILSHNIIPSIEKDSMALKSGLLFRNI